ncbi:MAG: Yip1 family protein [Pseudomonadales bacterium]
MLNNPFNFLLSPKKQWQTVANASLNALRTSALYTFILAALACYAWYYGTTTAGWQLPGGSELIRLAPDSALRIVIAFYCAIILALWGIGYAIHWMAGTYGSITTFTKGYAVAAYGATPLFLAGLAGFFPNLGLDLIIGMVAVSWAVYLLYTGLPIVMNIPEERGFLYASAVLGVCLVFLVAMMGATVVLWNFGLMPVFVD